jgi:hypothetical protein
LADLIFVFALFKWKKWGFYGFAITAILSVPLGSPSDPRPNLEYGRIPLLVAAAALNISLMYWFLQIGKKKRAWVQLD